MLTMMILPQPIMPVGSQAMMADFTIHGNARNATAFIN
jgi:hypothetical protein